MNKKVTVAGYLCLDIMPRICAAADGRKFSFVPGKLEEITGADMACGGATANTGLAMHILGMPVTLAARLGDDIVGMAIRNIISSYAPGLTEGLITDPTSTSSCTIVLNPPGQDRMFLVNPGANRKFNSTDISDTVLAESALLHFGYPPLLEQFYDDGGDNALNLFRRAHEHKTAVSLDMSLPDGDSESARVNWRQWLERVLPEVDVFLPSVEELRFMLNGDFTGDHAASGALNFDELHEMSAKLLAMGTSVVVIKLGSKGIYVRTSDSRQRLAACPSIPPHQIDNWLDREILCPCFDAEVRGTTGAGDCTIGGFLTGMLHEYSIEQTARLACAVGACNVEQPDAASGLLPLDATLQRLKNGWNMCDDNVDQKQWIKTNAGVYETR